LLTSSQQSGRFDAVASTERSNCYQHNIYIVPVHITCQSQKIFFNISHVSFQLFDDCALEDFFHFLIHPCQHDDGYAQENCELFRTLSVTFWSIHQHWEDWSHLSATSKQRTNGGILQVNNTPLVNLEKFCYRRIKLTSDATIDETMPWNYKQRFMFIEQWYSVHLYGAEAWTPYWRHIKKLDQFQTRCQGKIVNVKWQDKIPNTEVLERCQIDNIIIIISNGIYVTKCNIKSV